MSAEDSIEIEFPSRVEHSSASEPAIELPRDSTSDNDFAWLAAIFDDDEPLSDETLEVEESDADGTEALPVDEAEVDLASLVADALVTESTADQPAQEHLPDPSEQTVAGPAVPMPTASEPHRPDPPPDPAVKPVAPPPKADVSDLEPHPKGLANLKKVTGFREEILSTFSQMYDKKAHRIDE